MPLYDCMLLLKPQVKKDALMDLVARVGKHVYSRNGVLTDIKSFGVIHLGYGIKKLDGRHYKGHLMQLTMMATPNMNKELHYLNKEDRLLRWLLVKHRDVRYGLQYMDREDSDDDNGVPSLPGCAPDKGTGEVMSEDIEDDDDYYDEDDEDDSHHGWVEADP